MSWWTKNRKIVLPAIAGLAATVASGGTASPLLAGLLGGSEGAAGAVPLAATGMGEGGLLGLTGATNAAGAGAYELGSVGAAEGLGTMAAPPTSIPNALSAKLGQDGLLSSVAKNAVAKPAVAMQAMNMLSPQQAPMQMAPPPPPQAPQQQGTGFHGYGGQPDLRSLLSNPNLPPEVRQKLMMMMGRIQ